MQYAIVYIYDIDKVSFYALQGAIVYDVIGKGSAPAFFDVDPAQGTVSVINQALMKADNTPVYEVLLFCL